MSFAFLLRKAIQISRINQIYSSTQLLVSLVDLRVTARRPVKVPTASTKRTLGIFYLTDAISIPGLNLTAERTDI
ncbi:hypothetical protein CC2G_005511 [Coprinopsis cinerea AmutBmut pab1-1]|nr:hypothetical protein CC2G_005511 [Coprinopsis cinerea AmutBmut pab1-1]